MFTGHILCHHHTIIHYLLSTHIPAIADSGIIDSLIGPDFKKRFDF